MIEITGKLPKVIVDTLTKLDVVVSDVQVVGDDIDVFFTTNGVPTSLYAIYVGDYKWVIDELDDSANLFPTLEEGDTVSADNIAKLFTNAITSSLILSFNPLGRVKYGIKDVAGKVKDTVGKVGKAIGDWATDKVDADQAEKAIRNIGKVRTTYVDKRDGKTKTGNFKTTNINVGKIEPLDKQGHYKVLTGNPGTQDFQVFHLYRNGNKYRVLDAKTGLKADEAKWVYKNNIPEDYNEEDWKYDGKDDFMKQLDEEDNVTETKQNETVEESTEVEQEEESNVEDIGDPEDWWDTDVAAMDDEDNVTEIKKQKQRQRVASSVEEDEEDNVIESKPLRKKSKYNGMNVTGCVEADGTVALSSLQYITEDLKQFINYTGNLKNVKDDVKDKWKKIKDLLVEISIYDKDVLSRMTNPSGDNLIIDFNETGTGQNYTVTVELTPSRLNVIDKVSPDNGYEHLIKSLETVRDKLAPKV